VKGNTMTRRDDANLCEQALEHLRTLPLDVGTHHDATLLHYWLLEGQPVASEEAAINTAKRVLHEAGVIA
jgi:hypothetical protein